MSDPSVVINARYADAAQRLAEERVRFAREWMAVRPRVNSDMAATQHAIERTQDAITIIQAEMKILEANLD